MTVDARSLAMALLTPDALPHRTPRLIHFSATPLATLRSCEQTTGAMKPQGLWVSDEGGEDGWRAWCEDEHFGLDRLGVAHEVALAPDARILWIRTDVEIDEFTRRYVAATYDGFMERIDWCAVAAQYQGIVISPYQWSRRLTPHTHWYYGWDCASGCIWDPAAVESLTVVDLLPIRTPSCPWCRESVGWCARTGGANPCEGKDEAAAADVEIEQAPTIHVGGTR